ncbi:chaperone protein dnaJ 11, chloroplastic [Quercus robur]|uniref:chaperone protein dnaJ 11, chloroplastic n=1 Tax=Quercus robur TaxID=38942 RepID=UPI00216143AB|nr:chaperone protein dnaJ 11, chloroplastic [Quercus robur]
MLSSPSSFLTPPKFLAKPLNPAHASPRVRFSLPLAFAATATSSSAETCTNNTRSSSSYLPNMAAAAAACTSSPYQVLGISTGATCHEIKSAYRRLARTCHPDVAISTNRRDTSGGGEFMKVHAAYSTLSDPEKRADYDRRINIRRYQPLTASSGFSKYTRKNWETDQCW